MEIDGNNKIYRSQLERREERKRENKINGNNEDYHGQTEWL